MMKFPSSLMYIQTKVDPNLTDFPSTKKKEHTQFRINHHYVRVNHK